MSLLVWGCDSKVTTSALTEEDLAAQSKPANSSLDLLELQTNSTTPSCAPQNRLRLLVTVNQSQKILCRDFTAKKSDLTAGPICAEGIEITDFKSNQDWTDCAKVTVCGQAPTTASKLSSNSVSPMTQLEYRQLPWGCSGSLQWAPADHISDAAAARSIPIEITPPPCPTCASLGAATCAVCGTDTVKPILQQVLSEVVGCNQIRILVFAEDKESGLHRDAYSFDGGATWQNSSERIVKASSVNLEVNKIQVRDRAGNVTSWSKTVKETAPPCPCLAPWGETIPHGETRPAFKVGSVQCNQECSSQSIQRTCTNGILSGDSAYQFASCQILNCPQCTLPWGEKLSHGESATGYAAANVTCADQCKSTFLTCVKGVLQGDAATYKNKACAFSRPTCNCSFAGTIIPDGGSKSVYGKSEVACGETCTAGSVKCDKGSLSGDTAMTEFTCAVKECKCTTSWGQKLAPNEEVSAYKKDSLTCDEAVQCDVDSNRIKIKCTDVKTNTLTVTAGTGAIADFTKGSCSIPVCGCRHIGLVFRPSDPALKVYKISTATSPTTCNGQGNWGTVTCVKSGSNYVVKGDTNTGIFKYTQCQDNVGGGNSSENVGAGTGGGSGGGVGNSTGEGEGFSRRSSGFGSGCDVNASPYYCVGTIGGIKFREGGACYLPSLTGKRTWPTDIKDISERISVGTYYAAYSQQTVACGDSCSKYMGIVSCDASGMFNVDKYPYMECREVCP